MICQTTGEDWNQVKLQVSTADHTRWTQLPSLESRRLGRYQPPTTIPGWRPPLLNSEALLADYDGTGSVPPPLKPSASASPSARLSR